MNLNLFSNQDCSLTYESSVGDGYTFIDLFSGIGGFHLALSNLGATCVFASEKDSFARETYQANYDTSSFEFNDDIRKVSPEQIPEHDILCAGFPCQPFSQAGLKKGFQDGYDSERGNLFFCILDILEAKKPKAFILENVRHLIKHDDGKTFNTIQKLLKQAGYSVFYQVLKASDYNVPQHRPRVFIVGFRNGESLPPFMFPEKEPLTYTMSDIWGGKCEKEVGFTLRVGGRGSKIDDRRNWEFYRVDGEVKRIGISESKKMMTYPDSFHFPVSETQTMKQLGNSVCVNVVKKLAHSVFQYLQQNSLAHEDDKTMIKRNKGELSELYALCKTIYQQIINYGDINGHQSDDCIQVLKIHVADTEINLNQSEIQIYHNSKTDTLQLSEVITATELNDILSQIKTGKGTFNIPLLDKKSKLLSLEKTKGTSFEKSDITLSFLENEQIFNQQGTSVKSFLGNSPTLLNASQATNFIFKVTKLTSARIDEINSIKSRSKIKDRIQAIELAGGHFEFLQCENKTYESTLRKVDSQMPEILADALLAFFKKEISNSLSSYPQTLINE